MRGLFLLAAGALILTLGMGCQSNSQYSNQAYYQGQPRVNLYPLTAGAAQPVRGYGPTQVSTTADYYGQGNYAGYNNSGYTTGYYGNTGTYGGGTYQTAGYNPGYNTGGSYNGYSVSQDPFPAGTVGQGMGGGMVSNPYDPSGGYCRVEDVTAGMNPTVPIKDPPVVIGNNINLGSTGYTGGYTTGYTQPATYSTGYTTGTASTAGYTAGTYGAGYTTGSYGYTAPAALSATVSTTGTNYNYDSGPVPYCGPGVACPPDPRVDTSMYGGTTVIGGTQQQTTYGSTGGTADMFGSGYGSTASYGGQTYGAQTTYGGGYGSTMVGSGYTGGTDAYAGGAYPRAIDTIPATYRTNSFNPAISPVPASIDMGGGLRLVPARDIPPGIHPSDAGPSQWFEIVRPNNAAIRIGRVSASCVCVGVRVPKRQIAAGERALVEARILSRPPANNLTYGIFVNIVEPQKTVLDADVTITL